MTAVEIVSGPYLPATDQIDPLRRITAGWLLAFQSVHTRRAYTNDLNRWLAFCAEHDIQPLAARRGHVDAWARTMQQDGAATRTIARRIAAIASWYSYLISEEVIGQSPCEHVRRPAISQDGETPGLTRDEYRQLLAAAQGPRATALLTLLGYTGLRIGEALAADVEDLAHDRGHRILRIVRKGGKTGRTVLSAPVSRAIDEYLAGRTTGPLFITSSGQRMQQPEAWRCVRRTAKRAGLESADGIRPHSLRVAFITGAREAGVPLEDVQDAAGHADPRTTRRYDRGRHSLDRHATHALTAWLADGSDGQS
jgi:integrase/recombinase XerD